MSTTLPVPYSHTVESFQKGIDLKSGAWINAVYRIDDWADSDAFCRALLGITVLAGGVVTRTTPHQSPLATALVCHKATVVAGLGNPVTNADGYPDYDGGALVAAEYKPPEFDFSGLSYPDSQIDPTTPILYCTQELDFTTQIFTLPDAKYKYTASGLDTDVPIKIEVPITIMSLTFHQLPYIPMTAVRALRGRVNSVTFLGAAAGLVLFKGARTSREFASDGSVSQRVQLVYEERDAAFPWNYLPSRTSPVFQAVDDGSAAHNKLFLTGDLNGTLFT
jgi:hypothetical protein